MNHEEEKEEINENSKSSNKIIRKDEEKCLSINDSIEFSKIFINALVKKLEHHENKILELEYKHFLRETNINLDDKLLMKNMLTLPNLDYFGIERERIKLLLEKHKETFLKGEIIELNKKKYQIDSGSLLVNGKIHVNLPNFTLFYHYKIKNFTDLANLIVSIPNDPNYIEQEPSHYSLKHPMVVYLKGGITIIFNRNLMVECVHDSNTSQMLLFEENYPNKTKIYNIAEALDKLIGKNNNHFKNLYDASICSMKIISESIRNNIVFVALLCSLTDRNYDEERIEDLGNLIVPGLVG